MGGRGAEQDGQVVLGAGVDWVVGYPRRVDEWRGRRATNALSEGCAGSCRARGTMDLERVLKLADGGMTEYIFE